MTICNLVQRLFKTVVILSLLPSVQLFSQTNLITNPGFENGVTGFYTDYTYYPSGGMLSGCYCVDNTVSGHGEGSGFLPPSGSTGKYLIVNGFGGSGNQNKVVWRQTVEVTNNTWYTFSFKYANLSKLFIFYGNGAKLRFLINGEQPPGVSDIQLNAGDDEWHTHPNFRWYSGNLAGPIAIEFRDVYNGEPGDGDDFALDNISFVPDIVYGVAANPDDAFACFNNGPVEIDVLDNDVFQPGPNNTYTNVEVLTPQDQIPGTTTNVTVSNNKIYYSYDDADYTGSTADFQYKVTFHGGATSVNWVHVSLGKSPTIGNTNTIIPASICAPFDISLGTPTVQNNGSDLIAQGWQMHINDQWQDVPSTIEYEHNGCEIRYYAENGCGVSYSTAVPLNVNAAPLVGSITAPDGICEGDSFNLNEPPIAWRHNDPSTCWGSWEIQIDGVWDSLANHDIPFEYNGCSLRYKAVNGCGVPSYSTNIVQCEVYSTTPVFEGEITACEAIYHHGQYCAITGFYIWYDSITPNGCNLERVTWHFTLGEEYVALPETPVVCDSFYWDRKGRTYYENVFEYDTVYSDNSQTCDSIFILDLTVNHAPSIQGTIEMQDICVGGLLEVTEPAYVLNHVDGGSHEWEYATSPDGPFQTFAPETYLFENGSYYIRFAVINDCDSTFSNVELVHINAPPVISGQLSSQQVCEGHALDLPEVTVDWHNASQNGVSEWQMAENQEGPYVQFDSTMLMHLEHEGHWVRYMAYNECDTVYLGPGRITVIAKQEESQYYEDCDSVFFRGAWYRESQLVSDTVYDPCLHVVHHYIIVNHKEYSMEPIPQVTCHDEFEWHGHTYFRSDGLEQLMHFDTVTEHGCSKVMEQQLVFDNYSSKTENRIGCGTYYWPRNDSTYVYDEGHPYIQDTWFIAGEGEECDSIIFLSLDMGSDYELEGEPWTRCPGFEWYGVPYYEDTVLYDSLYTKITHCDSIVSHQLTIIQPVDVDTVSCGPFHWYENYCNGNGVWSHHFDSEQGCDSTVYLHVTMLRPKNNVQFLSRCDSITIRGVLYELPEGETTYSCRIILDTLVGPNGCDSILIINLTLRDSHNVGQISGNRHVFVASNLISGIYRYEIDTTSIHGAVSWSLTNPDWQVLDQDEVSCRIFVPTPGSAELVARFNADCGETERSFEINAGFFSVEDHACIAAYVYPNPTRGSVTIEAEGIESIRLSNMMGQVLEWRECDRSNSVIMELNGLAPSVYLLEIKTMNGMAKKRITLSR